MSSASSAGIASTFSICSFTILGLRRGQIDLVDHGNDGEVVARSEKRVRNGLRLNALARVDHQQRALARGKRARNFVGKIDVPRRVDQIQADTRGRRAPCSAGGCSSP